MHETFPNAPIAEALIDIRSQSACSEQSDSFRDFSGEVAAELPKKQSRVFYEARIELRDEQPPNYDGAKIRSTRLMYTSQSGDKVLQVGSDGFSFSKLRPYQTWEDLRDEARRYWELYAKLVQPVTVSRAAVRYINKIQIPLPLSDFSEYILTAPQLPKGLPQGISDFFTRVVIPEVSPGCTAIVNSTIERINLGEKLLPYIMDIDVYHETTMDPQSESIWAVFEDLRQCKNKIFFESITEKARELFR